MRRVSSAEKPSAAPTVDSAIGAVIFAMSDIMLIFVMRSKRVVVAIAWKYSIGR